MAAAGRTGGITVRGPLRGNAVGQAVPPACSRAGLNGGAHGFTCRTRPRPVLGNLRQSSLNRVSFDVSNDLLHFVPVADPVIVRLVLPKDLAGSPQEHIGPASGGTLDPSSDHWHLNAGCPEDVDVIGHDHPGSQAVESALPFPGEQGAGYDLSDATIREPLRPRPVQICLTVPRHERGAGGCSLRGSGRDDVRAGRQRAGQPPRDEEPRAFGVKMRESSPIVHERTSRGAGGTACPAFQNDSGGRNLTLSRNKAAGGTACPTKQNEP